MSIDSIFRVIIQTVIINDGSHFSVKIRNNFKFILDYIDKWNLSLNDNKCNIATKLF